MRNYTRYKVEYTNTYNNIFSDYFDRYQDALSRYVYYAEHRNTDYRNVSISGLKENDEWVDITPEVSKWVGEMKDLWN